jgi:hypothetical protein
MAVFLLTECTVDHFEDIKDSYWEDSLIMATVMSQNMLEIG